MFDTGCHDETITPYLESKEENITFMINVSEHVKRSEDMLMFLGEYFKELLQRTITVKENLEPGNNQKQNANALMWQEDFYLTQDILN